MARDDLEAMGFAPNLIDQAMANTDGSVEQCIDWLALHENGVEDTAPPKAPAKQLTAEDLQNLRAKAAQRKAEEEKQRRIDQHNIGKRQAEAERARHDMQAAKAKKDAEARKREVIEDRLYREKLRKKIEQDRLERESRERELKRQREAASSNVEPTGPASIVPTSSTNTTQSTEKKTPITSVRMRIRYQTKTLTKVVDPSLTVEDLGEELAPELDLAPGTFELESSYPKTTIVILGNTQTVAEAGLANASLTVNLV